MFNLGYKEVVLNEITDEIVYTGTGERGTTSTIAGYNTFIDSQIVSNVEQETVPKVGEVASWALPTIDPDWNFFEVEIWVYKIGNDKHQKLHFESTDVTAAGIVAGYEAYLALYNITGDDIAMVMTVGADIVTTIQPGYEQFFVHRVFARPVVLATSGGEFRTKSYSLVRTTVTSGNPGLLYGHQIEESRRLGTFDNTDPYSENEGGNSQGVVIDGEYHAFYITYADDETYNHEFVKHDHVNAALVTQDYNYVVYVLDEGTNIADFKAIFPLKAVPVV